MWTIPMDGFRWEVREDRKGLPHPSERKLVGLELPQVISFLEREASDLGAPRMSEPNGIDYVAVTSRASRRSAQCCFDGAVWRLYPEDAGAREYPADGAAVDYVLEKKGYWDGSEENSPSFTWALRPSSGSAEQEIAMPAVQVGSRAIEEVLAWILALNPKFPPFYVGAMDLVDCSPEDREEKGAKEPEGYCVSSLRRKNLGELKNLPGDVPRNLWNAALQ